MRLTTFTDYSVRVLIYLGINQERLATVAELADDYDISRNHLTKVVHFLGKRGYVDTLRGRGGGIRLACSPEEINIGQLVRETEKKTIIVECFNQDSSQCKITSACRLIDILNEAQQAFYAVLDKYTLQDLIVNPGLLHKLIEKKSLRHSLNHE